MRLHVTSGTTGEPVAIGLTQHDHEANSQLGGEAFAIAGLLPTDTVAHCLNYALYAGGIADHMAIEASGATVVPVGVGQSQRLLDLIPRLGITAIFGTLSASPPTSPPRRATQHLDPTTLGLRHIVTAGEPGAGLAAVRAEIERAWDVTVADTFGMSDVWSTMAGECGHSDGLHLTTGEHALLEVIDPETAEPLPLARRRPRRARVDAPRPPGLAPAALPLERPRDGLDRPLRVRPHHARASASAAAATTCCACRRSTSTRRRSASCSHGARHAIVADGDPIVPPLHVYVEGDADAAETQSRPAHRDRRPPARTGHAPGRRAQDREGVQDRARRPATRSHPEGS